MFDSLFGLPLAARFIIAFLVVLALIGVTAWVVRRFGAARLGGGSARGRQPRLAVIDAASVDGRRRLVLIRRDNIEHLLMIGGPTDVVIEPNIVRAGAPREPGRIDTPPPREAARATPAVESGWPLQPLSEPPAPAPAPMAPRRAARSARPRWRSRGPRRSPAPGRARPRISAASPPNCRRASPPRNCRRSRSRRATSRPRRASPSPPVPPEPAPTQDQNLADMAHQLEAALRRSPAPEGRPPVTDPLVQARPAEVRAALREAKPRSEPKLDIKPEPPRAEPKLDIKPEPLFEARPEPKLEAAAERHEPKLDIKPEPKPQPALKSQDFYDNLEEEMASLLGRPSGKS